MIPTVATTQKNVAMPARMRSRRRSRCTMFRARLRGSSSDNFGVVSSVSSALPSSLSFIVKFLFQLFAERALGVMQSRSHRSNLATNNPSDFLVAHVFDVSQYENLSLHGRQLVERRMD